jgi:hypothetical protein
VGVAADLSVVLSGGETALARVPGVAGRIGEVAGTVSRTIDPLSGVAKVARGAGEAGAQIVGGIGTHTGPEALKIAARSGYEGGEKGEAFRESMRGQAPMDQAVEDARSAVQKMRQERGKAYREGMTGISGDPTILDFEKIDDALADVSSIKTYKGQSLSPKTQDIRFEIGTAIKEWKALDPAEFHTVEGLDALKQKIGDIRDGTQYGTPQRVIADRAYQAIRKTITDQAPEYAKVMKGYEEASDLIGDIEKTLSVNPKASIDTSLRKLQSVLRDNVNTSFGRRAELAEYLVNAGAPLLMERLAGQALKPWLPRGLGKLGAQLGAEMLALGGGYAAGTGAIGFLPAAGLALTMSPRLMGEAAYYGGKAGSYIPFRSVGRGAYQTGRLSDVDNRKDLDSMVGQ